MALHSIMTYHGIAEDDYGMPNPWYHYLVVASPGANLGSGVASILPLSEARATGIGQGASHTIIVREGGPVAAINQAEAFLDTEHPGLRKIITNP